MKKLVIFGAGDMARLAAFYFERDTNYKVEGFSADREFCDGKEFLGKPLVPFDELVTAYPPGSVDVFVAISYMRMNSVRCEKLAEVKARGYSIASYISSRCSFMSQFEPGENSFILEDNTIQPYVKIGSNVWLWSGNHIGHDSVIEDNVYVSSHVVVSGFCTIGRNSFLGVNCTLREKLTVAPYTLIGAGAVVMKDTVERGVYLAPRSVMYKKRSDEIDF